MKKEDCTSCEKKPLGKRLWLLLLLEAMALFCLIISIFELPVFPGANSQAFLNLALTMNLVALALGAKMNRKK